MPTLNETLNWTAAAPKGSAQEKAFTGTPKKVKLTSKHRIARFHQYDSLTKTNALSPWWFIYSSNGAEKTYQTLVELGTPPNGTDAAGFEAAARTVLALRKDWNTMQYLFRAYPIEDIYCFAGLVAPQTTLENDVLGGNWIQLYIPNLQLNHLNNSSIEKTIISTPSSK